MRDVTDLFEFYRNSVRQIWNHCYVPTAKRYGGCFDLEESFCRVEIELFDSLIAYPLDDASSKLSRHMGEPDSCLSAYHVVPASDTAISVMIGRDKGRHPYWDYPLRLLKTGEVEMRFVHFMDFCGIDEIREYQFVLAEIVASEKYPDAVGRFALVEMEQVKILFAERSVGADEAAHL